MRVLVRQRRVIESKLIRVGTDYAETVAKRIAAKCDRWAAAHFEFLLASRASIQCLGQDSFKVVDVEVDVNWSPVALISTNVVSPFRRFGPSRFLDQSDLRVTALENHVCCDWPSDLGKSQRVAIKSKAFIKLRNVN